MARRATIQLDVETAEGRTATQQLENALADMGDRAEFVGLSFDDLEEQASRNLIELRTQAERASAATQQMATSTGTANQFATELGQASQDAAFGIQNVANQLPLLQAQFGRLQQQTGSTTGALRAAGSALIGPAGLIAAISLLLTFKEKIVAFFSDTGGAAGEAADRMEELEETVGSVIEVVSDRVQQLEISLSQVQGTLDETDSVIQRLEEREDFLERTPGLLRGVLAAPSRVGIPDLPTAQRLIERTAITREQLSRARQGDAEAEEAVRQALQDQIEATRQRLEDERAIRENLQDQQEDLERQLRLQERLQEKAGVRAADRDGGGAGAAAGIDIQAFLDLFSLQGRPEQFGPPGQQLIEQQMPTLNQSLQLFREMESQIDQIDFKLQQGFITPLEAAQQKAKALQQEMIKLRNAGVDPTSQAFQQLRQRWERASTQADNLEGNTDDTNQQLVRGIAAAEQFGTTLARAFDKGELSARRLLSAVLQLVGTIVAVNNPAAGAALGAFGGIIGGTGGSRGGDEEGGLRPSPTNRGASISPARSIRRAQGVGASAMQIQVVMSAAETNEAVTTVQGEDERMGTSTFSLT